MPAPSIWGLHIDGLRQKFPGKTQIMQSLTDDEILIQQQQQQQQNNGSAAASIVVQRLVLAHPSGWDLLIQLTQGFPDEPPIITFSGYRPPYRWSPGGPTTTTADTAGNGTLLHEAIDHAVSALTKLSGNMGPVSVAQIASSIAQQAHCSAAVEADALKAFIDQTTFGIACQKELDVVWDLIETTCRSNLEMQPQIQQVQVEVAQLQHRVKTGLAGLGARRKDVLDVLPLGSTDGLVRAAREELKELEDAAAQACKALGSVSASKNLVENLLKKKKKLMLISGNNKNNNNNNNNMRQQQQQRGTTTALQNQNQNQQPQNYQISFGNNNVNANNNNTSPSTVNNNATMMNEMDTFLGSGNNNNNNSAPRQAADIVDEDNNNQNEQASPSSTDAQIFFVPTMSPPSTANNNNQNSQQQQQQGSASVQSVFNSVLQAPLTFTLDNSNNNNNQNYYGNNNHEQIHDGDFSDDNNKDDNHEMDDDDDDDDVMDKAVEYSMKLCIEARRAAMLLRRFSAQQ